MISIGVDVSRPASNIASPGSSQATTSSAGNSVSAANTRPGSHGRRWYHCHPAPTSAITRAPGAASLAPTSRTFLCFGLTPLADCSPSPFSVRAGTPGDSADCGLSTGSSPARGSPAAAFPDPGTPERTVPTVDGVAVPDPPQPA